MKRTIWTAATACAIATLTGGAAFAASLPAPTGEPFDLDVARQLIVQGKVLYDVVFDTASGKSSMVQVGAASVAYDAIGFNEEDGFIYGIATANNHLLRIGSDGTAQDLGLPSGLTAAYPAPTQGVIAHTGVFTGHLFAHSFKADDASRRQLLDIHLDEGTSTAITLSKDVPDLADLVWLKDALWGFDGAGATVWRIDPATGEVSSFPAPAGLPTHQFGGQWLYGNGNVGLADNVTGDIYQVKIDPAAPSFTLVAKTAGTPSVHDDATSVLGLPADLGITATGPAMVVKGTDITYRLKVTNNGLGKSTGFVVNDALPAGLTVKTATGCDTTDPANLVCAGALGSGESQEFTVVAGTSEVTATTGGTAAVTTTATVLGNEADLTVANNTSTATTSVVDPGAPGAVIVTFVDEDGNVIADPQSKGGAVGGTYSSEPLEIQGYELDKTPTNANGGITEEPIAVTYTYRALPQPLTVTFVDEDGDQVAGPQESEVKTGATYTTEAQKITGFTLKTTPANATGTMPPGGVSVEYVYAKALPQQLTVKHVDEAGQELAGPQTSQVNEGAAYTTAPREISGYTLKTVPANAKGTMGADAVTVTYVYAKVVAGAPVTVKYVNEAGKELVAAVTKTGNVGNAYTSSAQAIPGYSLVTASANGNGTITAEPITVVFVYKADPQDLTVRYVDANGKELATATTSKVATDQAYSAAPKVITGYDLVTTPANAKGSMPAGPVTVTYVYQARASQTQSPAATNTSATNTPAATGSTATPGATPSSATPGANSSPTPVVASVGSLAVTGTNLGIATVVAVGLIGAGVTLVFRRLNANL